MGLFSRNKNVMGLFRRNKNVEAPIVLQNAININEVDTTTVCRPFLFNFWKKGRFDYAALILYIILEKIFNGLKNISWKTTKTQYTAQDIVSFIERNTVLIVQHYFKLGYACIIVDKYGNLRFPYQNELRFDNNGMITNKNAVVVYSDPYVLERKTHYMLCIPYLNDINDNFNNGNFVTNQQGLFGILSGKGIPMSPAAKDEMNEKLRKNYGYNEDQFNFILSNNEMTWTPIEVPVDKLKLDEKSTTDFKWISNLFGINPDFFLGGSTFSNQEDATKNFYRTAVIPLAEVLLSLGRAIFIKTSTDLEPSSIITYDLSNIPEMQSTLSAKCAERTAYLEYLLRLREAGIDIDGEIRKLGDETKTMLANI